MLLKLKERISGLAQLGSIERVAIEHSSKETAE
jgi:hypothetical protein